MLHTQPVPWVYLAIVFLSVAFAFFYLRISCFRKPTGQYGVGKVKYHWVDASRREYNNVVDNLAHRELMAYVYYPADNKIKRPAIPYDADAMTRNKAFVHLKSKIPQFLLKSWDSLKTYAQNDAPISSAQKQYPIVLISNSAGTMVQHYTWILEELASNGYVVVGINHPYMAAITRFPDDRVVQSLITEKQRISKSAYTEWKNEQIGVCATDIDFSIAKLKELNATAGQFLHSRLDLEHVGIVGHSFAGDIALVAGSRNPAIHAVVNIDGGDKALRYDLIKKPFSVPCMMILGGKSHQWSGEQGIKARNFLIHFAKHNNVSQVVIKDVGHNVFGDFPILLNSTLFTRVLSYFFNFDLDASAAKGCEAIEETGLHLLKFFGQHLKR